MSGELTPSDIKLHAVSYVLLGMLQRLDGIQPGLITDLLVGVRGDRQAAMSHPDVGAAVPAIFDEAIRFLERADLQNRK